MIDGAMSNLVPPVPAPKPVVSATSARNDSRANSENLSRDNNSYSSNSNTKADSNRSDYQAKNSEQNRSDNEPKSKSFDEELEVAAEQSGNKKKTKPEMVEGISEKFFQVNKTVQEAKIAPEDQPVLENANKNPILEFMDSMENEFGVEPERLIEAFGSMDNSQLSQAASQSGPVFVEQLGLRPGEQNQAENMYNKMLVQMKLAEAQKMQASSQQPAVDPKMSEILQSMQTLDEPIALPDNTIDEMNRRFFQTQDRDLDANSKTSFMRPSEMFQDSQMENASANQAATNGLQSDPSTDSAISTLDDLQSLYVSQKIADASNSDPAADGLDADAPVVKTNSLEFETLSPEEEVASLSSNENFDFDDDTSQNQDGAMESGGMKETGLENKLNKTTENGFGKILAGSDLSDKLDVEQRAELNNLVKDVSLLSKKGGGEMKVKMQSDELGQMQVKVAVVEGKVDVQLLTETKEAKKLLESELSFLKTDLAKQDLDLNEIKVDLARESRNEMFEEQARNQQREEARQFFKQFRDEQESRRDFEVNSGMIRYNSKAEEKADKARQIAAAYRAQEQGSQNLSIVA
ncbi:MAG: flagellar hook-length control protein FliK [Bdellovibrionales bacterium]